MAVAAGKGDFKLSVELKSLFIGIFPPLLPLPPISWSAFPSQSVAGVSKGLSEEVSSSVDTPRPVVGTGVCLKLCEINPEHEAGQASHAALKHTAPHIL